MGIDQIKLFIEIASGILTTLAILVGGIWTFFVYIIGRNHAPNIQLAIQCHPMIDAEGNTVLLKVTAKNVGHILVNRERCFLYITPISQPIRSNEFIISRLDPLHQEVLAHYPSTYEIFGSTASLNPGEQIDESVLLALNSRCNLYKVFVEFYNKPRIGKQLTWSSSAIFSTVYSNI